MYIVTSSNQRLGSAFYKICGVIMETGLCEEKQLENYGYAFLAGRADLNPSTQKPLKKLEGRPICSLHKKS